MNSLWSYHYCMHPDPYLLSVFNSCSCLQVFLTNSSNVFLLEPCHDVPKLLENQVEVCRAVLSIYRHMIMEHNMSRQTWYNFLHLLHTHKYYMYMHKYYMYMYYMFISETQQSIRDICYIFILYLNSFSYKYHAKYCLVIFP